MLKQTDYFFGKIWADTEDPIVFLTPKPLTSAGIIKELFRIVEEMSRYVSKKGTSRIFLMLNLKEIGGSNPELMAYYIRHQIQPRITRVPLAVLMIRSNDHQVMKIVENEIKDTTSDKVSIHSTFEEALRHIGYVIKCEHLKKPQSFISRFYAQITQLF